jgi:hypothetical protein
MTNFCRLTKNENVEISFLFEKNYLYIFTEKEMLILSKKSIQLELTSRNAIAELERKRNEEAEKNKIEDEASNLKERAKKVANQK